MRRSLPLVLVLLAAALAVAFWPSEPTGGLGDGLNEASAAEEQERAVADGGDVPQPVVSEVELEQAESAQRVEEEVDQGAHSGADTDPFANDLGLVHVHVRDGEGNPVPGAVAGALVIPELDSNDLTSLQGLFFAAQGVPSEGFPVREGLADEAGIAEIRVPVAQGLAIYARAEKHRIALDMLEVAASPAEEEPTATDVELVVLPGGFLQVTVVDELGAAVEEAAVVLTVSSQQGSGEIPIQFLLTDEAGQATFAHLSFATYQLEVVKDGHNYHRQEDVAVTTRGEAYLNVTIGRGTPVTGTVVDSSGAAVAGVQIDLRAKDRKHRPDDLPEMLLGERLLQTVSDDLGRFEISGLLDIASYGLTASPERGLKASLSGVKSGDDVYIELPPTAFIEGRVLRPEGGPDGNVRLRFVSQQLNGRGDPAHNVNARTNSDGEFSLMLPPGGYQWYAASKYGEASSGSVVDCFGEVDLGDISLLPGGDWQIAVVAPDGTPVRRASFESFRRVDSGNATEAQRLAYLRGRLDRSRFSDGIALRTGLTPGRYLAEIDVRGYLDVRVEGLIRRGQRTETKVTATQAGSVRFLLTDPDGQPVKGKFVLEHVGPMPAEWEHLRRQFNVQTNSKGDDRISGLLPSTWRLRATGGGGPNYGEFQVTGGSQTIEISLQPK